MLLACVGIHLLFDGASVFTILGFLKLPHVNTLIKKNINFTEQVSGFNADIIERLVIDSNVSSSMMR